MRVCLLPSHWLVVVYQNGVFVTFTLIGGGILMVCLLPSHWLAVVYWDCVCYLHTDLWWYIEGVYVTFTLTGGGILRLCLLPSHWLVVVYCGWTSRVFAVCYLHIDWRWYFEGEHIEALFFVTFTLTGGGILKVVCHTDTDSWWYIEGVFVTLTLTGGGILRMVCHFQTDWQWYIECGMSPSHSLVVLYWGRGFVRADEDLGGLPDRESRYQFFYWQYFSIQALDFESLWQFLFCGSTIATSVSFYIIKLTDWLQCHSMWLACQCS